MSRIGKQPVPIPEKVKVDIKGTTVHIEGPKGKVNKTFAPVVTITITDKKVIVAPIGDTRFANAMYGTARSIIASMVKGVTVGFSKDLEIQGVGFKANLRASSSTSRSATPTRSSWTSRRASRSPSSRAPR